MLSRSLLELIKCRLREFTREPSAAVFVVTMPILWMVILGFSITDGNAESYRIGLEASNGPLYESVQQLLENEARVTPVSSDISELKKLLIRGSISLVVKFSEDGSLTYLFDPSNQFAVRSRDVVDALIQKQFGRVDIIDVQDRPVTQKGGRYVDFLIPGLIAFSIMTSSLFGTGMTIVVNRRENVLKRYLVTPMPKFEYIFSHIVGRCFVLIVEFAAIMFAARVLFDFEVAGGVLPLFVLAVLGAACFTAIGMFCGARTVNTSTMIGASNLIAIPLMIVSGVWFSRAHFPEWLQTLTDLLPLAPLVDGLRKISLEGLSLAQIGPELLVLALYTIAAAIMVKVSFRWY